METYIMMFLGLNLAAKILLVLGFAITGFACWYFLFMETPLAKFDMSAIQKPSLEKDGYTELGVYENFKDELIDIFREHRDLGLRWETTMETCDMLYESFMREHPDNKLIQDMYRDGTWLQWYKRLLK
jgi:hypothetical protein